MAEFPPRPHGNTAPASNLALAAATTAATANPRLPLPSRRALATSTSRWRRLLLLGLGWLAALLAVRMPHLSPLAVVVFAAAPAFATALLLLDRGQALDRRARPFPLVLGTVLAAATIGAWLANHHLPGVRVMLFLPWLAVAMLLARGVGVGAPRGLLWLPALLLLGVALVWGNLLLTVQFHPTDHAQIDVTAGWPWPVYLGAVRRHVPPSVATLPAALWRDYAAMLGLAAVLLLASPKSWLARWLPHLAAVLAMLHFVGGYRLALATDG